jgi:phosphoadenosine phosphosulfate reductase
MTFTEAELHDLNSRFETLHPRLILRWAAETFGDKLAIVTSFQPTGIVTLHMMSLIAPRTSVLTLDTGLLFPETYALMDELEDRLNLRLTRVKPAQTVDQQAKQYGSALWERNPDACCNLRKVVPLGSALTGYEAWVTGLRRDQTGRDSTPIIAWDRKYNKVKLSPLANWTEGDIWLYLSDFDLPYNPLHDQGYPSIGCNTAVCTQSVPEGSSERAGRWINFDKNECGIHAVNG